MTNPPPFTWISPLGLSVVLFIIHGVMYLFIGLVAPWAMDSAASRDILVMSERTDTAVFGDSPENLRRSNTSLITLRRIAFTILAALMAAAGVMLISLAWFGLRQGHAWALTTLTAASAILLPYWWLVIREYVRAGVSPTLGDLPPFMWIPAILLVPAAILGWVALHP